MHKRTLIVVLVAVNLVLLAAVVFSGFEPPVARAQAVAQAGNYLMVTAKAQDDYDVLYVIDAASRTLHLFTVDRTNLRLQYRDYRDLARDLRAAPTPPPPARR